MNILIISNNPKRASFRQRVGVYLDFLRTYNLNCKVAKLPPGFLARLKLFRQASYFDGVFLHKKGLNFFDATSVRRYGKKIIYDFDDAIMYNPKHPERNSASHFRPFRRTARLADLVIAGNSYLAEHARIFNNHVKILPTGLDTSAFKTKPIRKTDDNIRLAWIGSKSTLRYLVAIKPALEEIGLRFDNVILRMICDEFFDLSNLKVEKRHWSQKTEVADLVTCDIGLAPLLENRFTKGKCGFKILQYAAAGLPVVASPVGINSEYVKERNTGFHATTLDLWIDRVALLIKNRQLRESMGKNGLELAKNFDIDRIGKQLAELILNLQANATS